MEDDYKLAVRSQRRVNPKIHDVIKKEVIKLLDTGMIYPISNSPWVSPIHCVPKKGGMTVVSNENNELIPTRLVTDWRDLPFSDSALLVYNRPPLRSCEYKTSGMEVCHALANLGASINLMPLSIWKKLSLPELTLTRMTLELADRLITHPKGVAEDVFVKVGKFHFPTDFIVVDFEADPSTMRYFSTYDDTSVNKVDVIDVACENFVQDVLDFQYNPKSSSPTLVSDDLISESDVSKVHIVKSSSPTLTLFGESDFFLKEIEDFLNDDSIPTGIKNFIYDPEGDILFLEKLLNEDPFQLPPMDLKFAEESKEKSFVEEPPELELKVLPSHLEYAFLEDSNKWPVIIAKNLKVDEREALINVLKSHKRAIAWKISDIKVLT
nr:hypothetical protein [Tanacetum cinerariifolium]